MNSPIKSDYSIISSYKLNNIIGNNDAKDILYESCILPSILPSNIFVGCREIQNSILLYGPPGTGKTMLAEAIACETQWPFFRLTPSSCLSKWSGESEKSLKKIFSDAKKIEPSIIFIDELDSIACKRSSIDEISSRRIISELLIQV